MRRPSPTPPRPAPAQAPPTTAHTAPTPAPPEPVARPPAHCRTPSPPVHRLACSSLKPLSTRENHENRPATEHPQMWTVTYPGERLAPTRHKPDIEIDPDRL